MAESQKAEPKKAPAKKSQKAEAGSELPAAVKMPEAASLRMAIGNAEQMISFAEGEIVREAHKIKALIAAGIVKAEDYVK